jgi:hypothetical protein
MEPVIEGVAVFLLRIEASHKNYEGDCWLRRCYWCVHHDGRYVRPHAFKKGAVEKHQTYSISVDDAAVIVLSDMRLHGQASKGAYVYVDSHFCLNDPKYIANDENGHVVMTEYARLHIDECCLAFDLKVKSKNKYGEQYYKECVFTAMRIPALSFRLSFQALQIRMLWQKPMQYFATSPKTQAVYKRHAAEVWRCTGIHDERMQPNGGGACRKRTYGCQDAPANEK